MMMNEVVEVKEMNAFIYIYIYIEREREREREVLMPSVLGLYHVFFYVIFLLCTFCPRLDCATFVKLLKCPW